MKVYEAVVKKGRIVPSDSLDLPEGTKVRITLNARVKSSHQKPPDPLENIEKLAIETGLPDFSEEHDHYLYGIPKLKGKKQ